jgi:hypothetical protein
MTTTVDTMVKERPSIRLEAVDVTGSKRMPVEVEGGLSADDAAETVAAMMALPSNVPWVLREDSSSAYLQGDVAIGDQLQPGARVTVTPRTHLGG